MSGEVEWLDKFAGWMAEHWPWVAGVGSAVIYSGKKVFNFLQGINRLADNQALMAKAISDSNHEIKERLDRLEEKQGKLMDAEGVDLRVAPVIQTVVAANEKIDTIREQVADLYRAILNPMQNGNRQYDPKD